MLYGSAHMSCSSQMLNYTYGLGLDLVNNNTCYLKQFILEIV